MCQAIISTNHGMRGLLMHMEMCVPEVGIKGRDKYLTSHTMCGM